MAIYQYRADGVPVGTRMAITVAGPGDHPWAAVAVGAGATFEISDQHCGDATRSIKLVAAANQTVARWVIPGHDSGTIRLAYYLENAHTAETSPIWIGSTSAAQAAMLTIRPTGQIRLFGRSSAAAAYATPSTPTQPGYPYWVELHYKVTAGILRAAVYDGVTAALVSDSGDITADVGAAGVTMTRFGKYATEADTATSYLASIYLDTDVAGLIGPPIMPRRRVRTGSGWVGAPKRALTGEGWKPARTIPLIQQHLYLIGSSSEYGGGATGATPPKWANSYPGRLAALIGSQSAGLVLCSHATYDSPTWDPRWTRTVGVSKQPLGWHKVSVWRIPTTDHVEFTTFCDEVRIHTFATGGIPTITIDDTPAEITPISGLHPGHEVHRAVTTPGVHTIRVAGPADLVGIEGRRAADRWIVHNASIPGRSLGTLGYSSNNNDEIGGRYGLPMVDTLLKAGSGQALVALTANEWTTGTPAATIEARLRAHIARIQATGIIPFAYVQPQPNPTLQGGAVTYTALRDLILTVAADTGIRVLDNWRLFAGSANSDETTLHNQGVANRLFADGIHPNDAGAAALAAAMRGFLEL